MAVSLKNSASMYSSAERIDDHDVHWRKSVADGRQGNERARGPLLDQTCPSGNYLRSVLLGFKC